jgi:hypothetical protein
MLMHTDKQGGHTRAYLERPTQAYLGDSQLSGQDMKSTFKHAQSGRKGDNITHRVRQ